MTKCAICGHRRHERTSERPMSMPFILRDLGVDGDHAHPSCAIEARSRAERKAQRTGSFPPRFRGTDFRKRN